LVEKGGRRWWCGGVVVGMEEEMEGRMVVEMVVEKVERVAGQGGTMAGFWAAMLPFAVGEERRNERERKKDGCIYKGVVLIITSLPLV